MHAGGVTKPVGGDACGMWRQRVVVHAKGAHERCDAVCSLGDGSRIASGSGDKTVRVWDVATKKCVATLRGTRGVIAVCGLGDGSRIASGSTTRRCACGMWRQRSAWPRLRGTRALGELRCAAWATARASRAAARDKTVRVWDVATKECVATLEGHTSTVNAVCSLGDGSRIASGSGQDGARVGCGDKEVRGHVEGHTHYVRAVCSLGDGSRIASGSDNTVRVWDVAMVGVRGHAGGAHRPCACGVQLGRRLAHRERQRRHDGARVGCGDEEVRGHAEGAWHGLCECGVMATGRASRPAARTRRCACTP